MSKTQTRKIARQIIKKYAQKLKEKNYHFEFIYLFGSYGKGNSHKWSDIDIAVVSKKLKRNYDKNRFLLWKLRRDIDLRIEPHGFTPEEFNDPCNPMAHEIKKTGIRVV